MAEINQFEEQNEIQNAAFDAEKQYEIQVATPDIETAEQQGEFQETVPDTVTAYEQYEEIRQYRRMTEEKIKDIDQLFRQLMSEVISYKEEIQQALYKPFFEDLAVLMSDMEYSNDVYASRLEHILRIAGIEPITPEAGDRLDMVLHERENSTETGTVITGRITKGWKLGERVLLRSIVTTDDSEGDADHE